MDLEATKQSSAEAFLGENRPRGGYLSGYTSRHAMRRRARSKSHRSSQVICRGEHRSAGVYALSPRRECRQHGLYARLPRAVEPGPRPRPLEDKIVAPALADWRACSWPCTELHTERCSWLQRRPGPARDERASRLLPGLGPSRAARPEPAPRTQAHPPASAASGMGAQKKQNMQNQSTRPRPARGSLR